MSATDKEFVEKVIGNNDPFRGRVGTDLAGVLLYVIGAAFACPVSSDTVARSGRGPSVTKNIGERNPDFIFAYALSSNHHVISDPVTVALGSEPGCSSLEVASALSSYFESDADVATSPADAAEERVRDDMGAIVGDDDVAT
eukprot:6352946-Pyramimonas_sp.AAC.1